MKRVVGGLLGYPFGNKGGINGDFNNYINTGLYRMASETTMANNPGFRYGQLRVYNDGYYVIQEALSLIDFTIKIRLKSEDWSEWVQL